MKVFYYFLVGIKMYEEFVKFYKDFLLWFVGILYIVGIKVGDVYICGVFGGERKWVFIFEVFMIWVSVFCWDDFMRGFDVSIVLEWVKVICIMIDVFGLIMIVIFY